MVIKTVVGMSEVAFAEPGERVEGLIERGELQALVPLYPSAEYLFGKKSKENAERLYCLAMEERRMPYFRFSLHGRIYFQVADLERAKRHGDFDPPPSPATVPVPPRPKPSFWARVLRK